MLRENDVIGNTICRIFITFGVSFILMGLSPLSVQVCLKREGRALLVLDVVGLVLSVNAVIE